MLSQKELEQRDDLIKKGIAECRGLIGKQTSREMYSFYEGSIDGFEECKKLNNLEAYIGRIEELNQTEIKEIAYSFLRGDDMEKILLREELQIYNSNRETDLDKVWKLKGIRTQIEFVYNQLKAYKFILNSIKKEATMHDLSLKL